MGRLKSTKDTISKTDASKITSNDDSSPKKLFDGSADLTPGMKLTACGARVVSVLLEVTSCSGLVKNENASNHTDPYIKVKLVKPTKRGGSKVNIHKMRM